MSVISCSVNCPPVVSVVLYLDIVSCLEEESDHLKIAYFGGYFNRGLAVYTSRSVDVYAGSDSNDNDVYIAYKKSLLETVCGVRIIPYRNRRLSWLLSIRAL